MAKKTRFLTGLFVIIVLGSMATAVFAHEVDILKSIPANGEVLNESPANVTIWYSEELISGASTLIVINNQGSQVDNGDGGIDLNDSDHASMIVTLPPLPDGAYTVQWHAALLDGDTTTGGYAFAIGEGQIPVLTTPATTVAVEVSSGSAMGTIGASILSLAAFLLIIGLVMRRRRQS